ncbi:cation:H+ antiporter [Tepidamorphus gemmatus]|uniref:Cation:H+ antiporter n=1 Tax=Tepidamorphus gemmatus TaxID=747076 RepID=A0A4R3MIB4_9HYPH|nr:calcium/sodium antiporter [Tepidamorphus gemmatus]TCT13372.1 cation:H+ antiporter [Tepidamorphus gemmatus]
MILSILLLAGGLVLLFAGGELLVRGSVRLAVGLGISPLVIGLTVVGFGTSTPELVTSVQAALRDTPGIAIGNIVGSNIANILLIVGLSSLVYPIAIDSRGLKRDGAIMLAVAVVFAVLSAVMPLGRGIGLALLAALVVYVAVIVRIEMRDARSEHGAIFDKARALEEVDPELDPERPQPHSPLVSLGLCLIGLALLVAGGHLLVDGAVDLARGLGISETVIGLTIVAVGTSLPELVTSLVAAFRREADVAFGNIVGSNIYNILGIGGATAAISPLTVPQDIVTFDNIAMTAVSAVLLLVAWTGMRISRVEGAALLAAYAGYVYLIWP